MTRPDESELRIVEVKGALPVRQLLRSVRAMPQPRRSPTREDALKAIQSMKGAASAIERVPMLEKITSWIEFAYWGLREQTGGALSVAGGLYVWNCDFVYGFEFGDAYNYISESNSSLGMVYFAGMDPVFGLAGGVEPPAGVLTGQVWCYMDVTVDGSYLFVAQVETLGDPTGYTATIECWIDATFLGTATLTTAQGSHYFPFVAQLSTGLHRFQIKQCTGALYFVSLTAWQMPYPAPPPVVFTESQ